MVAFYHHVALLTASLFILHLSVPVPDSADDLRTAIRGTTL